MTSASTPPGTTAGCSSTSPPSTATPSAPCSTTPAARLPPPTPPRQVAIRSKPRPLPEKQAVLGFVERIENNRTVATDQPKDYPCTIEEDFEPTLLVPRPAAYLIPPGPAQDRAADLLLAHGIQFSRFEKPTTHAVTVERIDALTRSRRLFEGHNLVDITAVTPQPGDRECPVGTILVPTNQPLGNLAAYLLEPRSDDGLAAWDLLGAEVTPGRDFPIWKGR